MPGQAQGFYSCTTENGFVLEALIMPNDVFYGVIFQQPLQAGFSTPAALLTGQGASGNDTYTGTMAQYLNTQSATSATVNATDVPQTSISGTITSSTQVGFGGAALSSNFYQFSTPASIAAIAGTWTGTLLDGSPVTLNVSTSGSISTTSTGCAITGTLTANTNNNVFTANLTFGSLCAPALTNQSTSSAVAMIFILPDGATQQLMMPASIGTTAGTVFVAQK